jgi:hypothetical protein
MLTTKSKVSDPHAPRTFRRATTVTWAILMTVLLAVIAGFMTSGYVGHGFFSAAAPICVVAPLIAFAILSFYWPHVVVSDDAITVRNAFTVYRIPYAAVKDLREARIGLFVILHDGRKVPVTAYVSGSSAKLFGHNKALRTLIDAIEDKMSYAPKDANDVTVVRTVETVNIVIAAVAAALAIGVLWAAIVTYN